MSHQQNDLMQYFSEKLHRFESLLMKCKENIKHHIERNSELQAENEILKQTEAQKSEEAENIQVKESEHSPE